MSRYFVPALLLCGTLYFGYLYLQEPTNPLLQPQERQQGSVRYNQVQQYQQETAVKMDIKQQKAEMDKRVSGPELRPGERKRSQFHETELRKDGDVSAFDLRDESVYKAMTLDQRMDAFLAQKQQYEELEKRQKMAYVRQFVQEAYKMGFVVRVNDDMEIEKVSKVKSR